MFAMNGKHDLLESLPTQRSKVAT